MSTRDRGSRVTRDEGPQPFRDDFAAALDKNSHLERENEELRLELARLRSGGRSGGPAEAAPPPPRPPWPAPTISPPDSLKTATLERLERLSEEIDSHDPAPEPDLASPLAGAPVKAHAVPMMMKAQGIELAATTSRELERAFEEAAALEAQKKEMAELRFSNEALRRQLTQRYPPAGVFFGAVLVAFWIGYFAGHIHC